MTDQNYVSNTLGAGASILSNPFAATTTWQRLSYTYGVPATATQVVPLITYTPSGTAGAADYLDVTGVQLEIASSPTSFELRPYAIELQLCQRYYEIILEMPAAVFLSYQSGGTGAYAIPYKVTKRANASLASGTVGVAGVASAITLSSTLTNMYATVTYSGSGTSWVSFPNPAAVTCEL